MIPRVFGITVGWPATVAEITELVVPRSMPTATAITASCYEDLYAVPGLAFLPPVSWAAPGARGMRVVSR